MARPTKLGEITSDEDFKKRMEELNEYERLDQMRKQIERREEALGVRKKFSISPSWSKIMMVVVYLVCVEIIAYAECVMWFHYDTSALYALIGVPVAMFGTFWAYAEKSKAENTKGGIKHDTAMYEMEHEADPDPVDIPEGDEDNGVG